MVADGGNLGSWEKDDAAQFSYALKNNMFVAPMVARR